MKNINKQRTFGKYFTNSLCICAALVALSSCYGPARDHNESYGDAQKARYNGLENDIEQWMDRNLAFDQDFIDPKISATREDYTDYFVSKPATKKIHKNVKLPDISHLLSTPTKPILNEDKVVTISVTEEVPLKDVLIELARRADIDMEIDTNISGGIILSVKEKPFSEVIHRIANMAGLVYSLENDTLKVSVDTPTLVNYQFNMLNMVRTASGSINTANELGSGDSGITNGSTSSLDSTVDDTDMWSIVESGITNILATQLANNSSENETSSNTADPSIVSLNKMAGVVTINAPQSLHKEVKKYLDYVSLSYTSQVLIEAKVLEVKLDEEFRSGIDWNIIETIDVDNVSIDSLRSQFNSISDEDPALSQLFSLGGTVNVLGTSLNAAINLVENFGTTRTLSSPRLHAMNNQFAMLSFATNFVYFEITVETEEDGDGASTVTPEVTPQTVPIGVVLNLMPSIDLEKNEVLMSIRPTLTRIVRLVDDPVTPANQIPEVGVRELDTVLRIKSGEVMVIGGLLSQENDNDDSGIPGISKIPFFGNAFKSVQKASSIVETVIFIKATIVPGVGVSAKDADFYNKFSRDRHRFEI